MYKIFKLPMLMFVATLFFAACKKDGDNLELQPGKFNSSSSLAASLNSLVLMQGSENDTALRFTWPAAYFGPSPQISYTLQLDVPSDTTAANNWGNAKNYVLGSNIFQYGFKNKDLNAVLNDMHLQNGTPLPIVFRIKADVNQAGGSASTVPSVYTNSVAVTITSYGITLWVPGEFQGWNPAAAPVFPPVNGRTGLFEGYINFAGTGTQYFKFTNAPDWNHTNYGDGGNGTFNTDGAAGGLSVPGAGYYMLTANLNNNTWTATKTDWGIVGDATPNGWNVGTPMTYDAASQTWKVTVNMIKNGSFKFRANNEWVIDFGIDATGKLKYADNPFLGYTPDLNNLSVPEDGNYTITLDLHQSQQYTYTLHKN